MTLSAKSATAQRNINLSFHRQMCQGNNQDDRVDDTHHFLFAGALRGHDTYTWRNVNGQVRVLYILLFLLFKL